MKKTFFLFIFLNFLCVTARYVESNAFIKNPSFEIGISSSSPDYWVLSGGNWENQAHSGKKSISVTGTGEYSNFWKYTEMKLEPGKTYRISFWVKTENARGGCIISGPYFCNMDYLGVGTNWEKKSFVFTVPDKIDEEYEYIRFGQYMLKGKVFFDDIEINEVKPIHLSFNKIELGKGEFITLKGIFDKKNCYNAKFGFSSDGTNYSRFLKHFTARFNTSRFVFSNNSYIIFCHKIGEYRQKRVTLTVGVNYYVGGKCIIEASSNGENFEPFGEINEAEIKTFSLPEKLFPANEIFIRLRCIGSTDQHGDSHPGTFQINRYHYKAQLTRSLPDITGKTCFLEIIADTGVVKVDITSLGLLIPGEDNFVISNIKNLSQETISVEISIFIDKKYSQLIKILPAKSKKVKIPYEIASTGSGELKINITDTKTKKILYTSKTQYFIPYLLACDYGYLLDKEFGAWWCEGTYKISRERILPKIRKEIEVYAAKNEHGQFQLVLRPKKKYKNVSVSITELYGQKGKISRDNIKINLVGCVYTEDLLPDPLPPYREPFKLEKNKNQPVRIRIYIPPGTVSGEYKGEITITADRVIKKYPFKLTCRR